MKSPLPELVRLLYFFLSVFVIIEWIEKEKMKFLKNNG